MHWHHPEVDCSSPGKDLLAHTCPPAESVTSALLLMLACSSHVPAVALRNLFYDLTEPIPERIVDIHGFSAGSYTGMLAWHCIHIYGNILGLKLRETLLGAITFPVRFFHRNSMTQALLLCIVPTTPYVLWPKAWRSLKRLRKETSSSTCNHKS